MPETKQWLVVLRLTEREGSGECDNPWYTSDDVQVQIRYALTRFGSIRDITIDTISAEEVH
jgi:hypothetical protein